MEYHIPALLPQVLEAMDIRADGVYVDVTYDNLTRYRQSIDAIIPLTKELKILGEYEQY